MGDQGREREKMEQEREQSICELDTDSGSGKGGTATAVALSHSTAEHCPLCHTMAENPELMSIVKRSALTVQPI